MPSPASHDLTGAWDGWYAYPRGREPTPFQAVILELGDGITGSVWEIGDAGPERGRRLNATIEGAREGRRVAFVKQYDGTGGRAHTVAYEGELNEDATEIAGRWTIPGVWSGRFAMTRPRRREAAVERKAAERAG